MFIGVKWRCLLLIAESISKRSYISKEKAGWLVASLSMRLKYSILTDICARCSQYGPRTHDPDTVGNGNG